MSIKFDQYTNTLSVTDSSATNADLNVVSQGTGAVNLSTGNGIQFKAADTLGSVASANYVKVQGRASGGPPFITVDGSDSNTSLGISSKGAAYLQFYTNSTADEQFRITNTASAVNYVQVTGSATLTGGPTVSAQGSDFNIPLRLSSKGISAVELGNPAGWAGLTVTTTNNPNRIALNAPATGFIPTFTTAGVDTNAGMAFISKGTGAIDLAAGSSGVNISNGGTVTATTRTATGAYTATPSVTISAPTTAGGVQATGVAILQNTSATIAGGGTGYTVGDTLTMVGGTLQTGGAGTFRVASVSGGVITSVDTPNYSQYLTLPTNPVSVTGGTGSGATLTVTYIFGYVAITNAGSGYVEQPTITFSGGTGSGAAAYATVGSGTVVRSLGTNFDFYVPSSVSSASPAFRITDGGSSTLYPQVSNFGGTVNLFAQGATNTPLFLASNGTSSVTIGTNGASRTTQMVVAHTASAVNYVQVTGAATGNSPNIAAQGSDSNINMAYSSKGTYGHAFYSNNFGQLQFTVTHAASAVNWFQASGGATGFGAVLSAQGSDANIPAVVQPKGTGALQAQQTDSTATGGNARGANAVDWQTSRDAASRVASGSTSGVLSGVSNTAAAVNSIVSGGQSNNISSSGYSGGILSGLSNQVNGFYSPVVGGASNQANGYYNFIGGGFTNSATSNSAVTTQSGTMNGTTAVTLSGSNGSIKVGQYISGTSISNNTYVAAISGTSLTLSQAASGSSTSTLSFYTPHGVVVGGGNNQATGSYSFIGGGGDAGTAANRNVASGDWSFVGGGAKNTASGKGAVVCGGGGDGTNFYTNSSSGISSFVGAGTNNYAQSVHSAVVAGVSNVSSGYGSFIGGGWNNVANSGYSAVLGGAFGSARSIEGSFAFAACAAPIAQSIGVSQSALLVLGTQTTDATATVLRSNTSAAGTTNQVILPNNSAYYFKGSIVAGVTGAGDTAAWEFVGTIKRGASAGTTALVGTPTLDLVAQDTGASTWTVALTADTTNGGLAVTVTGQATTTIRWVAKIETTEMTY